MAGRVWSWVFTFSARMLELVGTGYFPACRSVRLSKTNKTTGLISGGSDSKVSACNAGDPGFNPWVGKIPWRRERLPAPVFLPGESHGQRSLAGYRPCDLRVGHD